MLLISTPLTFCFRFLTFGGSETTFFLRMFGFYQAAQRMIEVCGLRRSNSVENAIIRITLLGFLLHFLFDLLRSPKGSWVGTEDSRA